MRRQRIRGFTIVELLIVIVVIAILAAITVVAYNGVQKRAANTTSRSAAASLIKKLEMYKQLYGGYPVIHTSSGYVCVGNYTFAHDFPTGICGLDELYMNDGHYNPIGEQDNDLENELKKIGTLDSAYNGVVFGTGSAGGGLMYAAAYGPAGASPLATTATYRLYYFLDGANEACSPGVKESSAGQLVVCRVTPS